MPHKNKSKVNKHSRHGHEKSHGKSHKGEKESSPKAQVKKIPKQEATLNASNITGLSQQNAQTATTGATGGLPKNFRSHPDIENFFRFIYENDLREEALVILEDVIQKKAAKKAAQHA